jgi:hypothetical protein
MLASNDSSTYLLHDIFQAYGHVLGLHPHFSLPNASDNPLMPFYNGWPCAALPDMEACADEARAHYKREGFEFDETALRAWRDHVLRQSDPALALEAALASPLLLEPKAVQAQEMDEVLPPYDVPEITLTGVKNKPTTFRVEPEEGTEGAASKPKLRELFQEAKDLRREGESYAPGQRAPAAKAPPASRRQRTRAKAKANSSKVAPKRAPPKNARSGAAPRPSAPPKDKEEASGFPKPQEPLPWQTETREEFERSNRAWKGMPDPPLQVAKSDLPPTSTPVFGADAPPFPARPFTFDWSRPSDDFGQNPPNGGSEG